MKRRAFFGIFAGLATVPFADKKSNPKPRDGCDLAIGGPPGSDCGASDISTARTNLSLGIGENEQQEYRRYTGHEELKLIP